MKPVSISVRDVCKNFAGSDTNVLDKINVDIFEGDFTIIMGSSGAGKSTLLYALSGMDSITSGNVIYKEREINSLSENQMADLRMKEFGVVFQQTHLVSNLSLFENVAVAGYVSTRVSNGESVDKKAKRLLQQMGAYNAKNRLPSQISGGEAQRAAIRGSRILFMEDGRILDELTLFPYQTEDEKARESVVNEWLTMLRW